MSRILITGATGFIGRHLVRRLQTKHNIFAVARKASRQEQMTGVYWIEQDLTDPLDSSRLPKRIDAIIHLAQSKHYRQFPDRAEEIYKVNIHSTFELLEYARQAGAECFILASTGGMYGYSYDKFTETKPISLANLYQNPLSFYFSSKYAAELIVSNYQQLLRTVICRCFFVYGPDQKNMLFPTLLRKVQLGEPIIIQGNPGLRTNPIYVGDAIRVLEQALHVPASGIFNVAGDEIVTITDLVRLIAKVVDKEANIQYTDANSSGHLIGDNTQMKERLGISLKTPLLKGVSNMVQGLEE